MNDNMIKIGRLLLIPILIILVFGIMLNVKNVSQAVHEKSLYENSMQGGWKKISAPVPDHLLLYQTVPYVAGTDMTYFARYTYKVDGKDCAGSRYAFGHGASGQISLAPNDVRLHWLIKNYCPQQPKKTNLDGMIKYEYTCYPIPVFYNPKDVCEAYLFAPLVATRVEQVLSGNIHKPLIILVIECAAALACIWGLWPLIKRSKN